MATALEQNSPELGTPEGNAYGRVIRERGTLKVILLAAAVAIIWYSYSSLHVFLMNRVKWPPLQTDPKGLTILGLHTKDFPGSPKKHVAIEAGHAWHVRSPEDADFDTSPDSSPDQTDQTEKQERGRDPGASHSVSHGRIIPVEELMRTCPVVLTGAHLSNAWLEEQEEILLSRHYWVIHVDLNDEGSSRYWQYSQSHDGEKLAFVLNGDLMTCPVLHRMYVGTFEVGPIWVEADAKQLADFINKKK